jgi:hypothetical protein
MEACPFLSDLPFCRQIMDFALLCPQSAAATMIEIEKVAQKKTFDVQKCLFKIQKGCIFSSGAHFVKYKYSCITYDTFVYFLMSEVLRI